MFLRQCLHAFVLWIWNKSTVLFDSSPYELGKGLDFLGHWFFVITVSWSLSFYFGTTFLPSTFWHFLYLWGGTTALYLSVGTTKKSHLYRLALETVGTQEIQGVTACSMRDHVAEVTPPTEKVLLMMGKNHALHVVHRGLLFVADPIPPCLLGRGCLEGDKCIICEPFKLKGSTVWFCINWATLKSLTFLRQYSFGVVFSAFKLF